MGDMMMSKVFRRLPEMRAFQRTPNRDHTINIFEYMSIDRGGLCKKHPHLQVIIQLNIGLPRRDSNLYESMGEDLICEALF